jgi:peptide/nickel transport system permease protein
LVGARSSLEIAFGSALFGLIVGVAIGLVGGYFGRWVDAVFMRVMDLLLAVPILLVALVVVVVLGPSSINVVVAIGVASVPIFARLARASVLEVRERDYVAAAKAMGATSPDVMLRTILPNITGPLIVQFVVSAASAVVVAASLSFLGLGVPPPAPTWGAMLHQSQSFLFDNPWYGVFPGIALAIAVLLLDRIGKGLERAFGARGAIDSMAGSS